MMTMKETCTGVCCIGKIAAVHGRTCEAGGGSCTFPTGGGVHDAHVDWIQGYLAHNKSPPPLQDPHKAPGMGLLYSVGS